MPRRPSFQFYPADWLANSKLRAASHADRGLWIDVMCVLADSDDGFGLVRWELSRLASAAGCHVNQIKSLVRQDILKGATVGHRSDPVTYTDSYGTTHSVLVPQPGPVWYSTRMLIDEWKRQRDRANGEKRLARASPKPSTLPPTQALKEKGKEKRSSGGRGAGGGTNGHAREPTQAERIALARAGNPIPARSP